jgi:hypothetical protein
MRPGISALLPQTAEIVYIYTIPCKPPEGVWQGVLGHQPYKGWEVQGERIYWGKAVCAVIIERVFIVYCDRLSFVERMSSCIFLFGNVSF